MRAEETLGRRALNRALLGRQLLLRRASMSVGEAVAHLVGLQAQAAAPPYYGLWSRLAGFRPQMLSDGIVDRSLVRIALMRGTIHLVTARDALELRPVVQPVMERDLRQNFTHAARIEGLDPAALAAAGRALLDERPRTGQELGAALQARWPDRPAASLAWAIRGLLPLVQIPPRGLWGSSGQPVLATAESWLGGRLTARPAPARMLRRYLAAFGPASVRDMQAWSGLTRLGEVVEAMRPKLRTFRDGQGRVLFDLPNAQRADPDAPAPVRLIAPWDNLLCAHADRSRIVAEEDRKRSFAAKNGVNPGAVLIDGFVAGTWRLDLQRAAAAVRIETFSQVSAGDRAALEEEGGRLLALVAPEAPRQDVQVARRR